MVCRTHLATFWLIDQCAEAGRLAQHLSLCPGCLCSKSHLLVRTLLPNDGLKGNPCTQAELCGGEAEAG